MASPPGRSLPDRSLVMRIFNSVRGPMQKQAVKDSKLIQYIREKDYNKVSKYLNRGANVNVVDAEGKTPMEHALIVALLPDSEIQTPTLPNFIIGFSIARLLLTKKPQFWNLISFNKLIIILRSIVNIAKRENNIEKHTNGVRLYRELVYTIEPNQRYIYIINLQFHETLNRELQFLHKSKEIMTQEGINIEATLQEQLRIFNEQEEIHRIAAEQEQRRFAAPVEDAYNVHRESHKFIQKIPEILGIINGDLNNGDLKKPDPVKYEDINAVFDTLAGHITRSPEFESKAINSIQVNKPDGTKGPKVLSRAEWLIDVEKVKQAVSGSTSDKKTQMGLIFDFIIKYKELTDCFIVGFISDCTNAYANGHISCYAGIIERTISTLINCIKGMNEGIFGKLNEIIEGNIKSWAELDKGKQAVYIMAWNQFLIDWSKKNNSVQNIKDMEPTARSHAAMADFKSEQPIPSYVEEHIKSELFEGLNDMWEDYGFNSHDGNSHDGGRYRKKTRKYRKKSKRTRRH